MTYRKDIDGLRALAVVAVILNHFEDTLLPSGFLGVDVFFVISGYVITVSLSNNVGKSLSDLLAGFYVRRIKRLVPALVLCVAVTSIAIGLFDPIPKFSIRTGIAALAGLSNVYLNRHATDYFGGAASLNVFTQTWSLGVEEQFYVFFPFLVWFTGFGRSGSHGSRLFAGIVGVATIGSLFASAYLGQRNQAAAFYSMPTRFWELGAGCLAFSVLERFEGKSIASVAKAGHWSVVTLALLVAALWLPRDLLTYSTMVVVFLTSLFIVILQPGTLGFRVLTSGTAVFLGRISYSLYLWHWSVLTLSRWTIGIHWWSAWFQVGLMLALAIASYRYVERPLRQAEWSAVRWKTIGLGVGSLVGAATLLAVLGGPLAATLYSGRGSGLIAVGVQSLKDSYSVPGTPYSWAGAECILTSNTEIGRTLPSERCTLGDFQRATRRVLVLGDSHSAAYVQSFDEVVRSGQFAVTITSSWGASPVSEIPNESQWDRANEYYWETVAPSLISRLRRGDWVLLIFDLARFAPAQPSISSEQQLKQFESGLVALESGLASAGIRLAVLHGNPFAREANCDPAIAASQWFAPSGGPCRFLSRELTVSRRRSLDAVLAGLRRQGKIATVDLINVFCPRAICSYHAANGQLLYRDVYSHASVEAARLAAPLFREVLTAPVP